MNRKEVKDACKTEESWRAETLWRLDTLTWQQKQVVDLLTRWVGQLERTGGKKTEHLR